MADNINNPLTPEYVPEEYQVPFDVLELPSQGLLYKNKKSTVRVEYLTAFDETILSSPNISNSGKMMDVLLERKIKDLGFDPLDLLVSDRVSVLIFLRTTAFGTDYSQIVVTDDNELVEASIDLSTLKQKKLTVKPDNDGMFDFVLPNSKKKIKFRFLTGRDESEIEVLDKTYVEKNGSDISNKLFFRLEKQVMSIDNITDKIKISNILKSLSIKDSRLLRRYMDSIESGIDFKTTARTPGGVSVDCFLRFNSTFFFPEI